MTLLKNIKGYETESMDALIDASFTWEEDAFGYEQRSVSDFKVVEVYARGRTFDFDMLSLRHKKNIKELCWQVVDEHSIAKDFDADLKAEQYERSHA